MELEPVIGLEVHAELLTRSKMFCACPVVDLTQAEPNTAVCPICSGMPGTLPVVNRKAVEYALRVALALECQVSPTSIFARKNYFYPDLPKGYQISQYEQPLARHGRLHIQTSLGEKTIRIRRVHLEEDTGKLTHIESNGDSYSLVDLNRAGVPLLEIVTEPDFQTAEEVRAYATALRSLLRYLEVNSGDLEKGVMRIEPNISLRPKGSNTLGTKVEIKNLNSFKAIERAVAYEIIRQGQLLRQGLPVRQETVGWDDVKETTFTQRVKEGEDDYRYFPEPDLPPLVVTEAWIETVRASLPELPDTKYHRFRDQYGLLHAEASLLVSEQAVAVYFEKAVEATKAVSPRMVANWVTGELFALMNQSGLDIESVKVSPFELSALLELVKKDAINQTTAKTVLAEMFTTGQKAADIVTEKGLEQVSDIDFIASVVQETLQENPDEVASYRAGKTTVSNWLFGQVMRKVGGRANPQVVRQELDRQLNE